MKKAYRRVQQLKRSTSKDEAKREARQGEIEQAYRHYLELAGDFLARVRDTRAMLHIGCSLPVAMLTELDAYIADIERQSDQIRRRVLRGERRGRQPGDHASIPKGERGKMNSLR